jgi:hypothetical protein
MKSLWKLPAFVVSTVAVLGTGELAHGKVTPHAKPPYLMVPAGAATFAALDPKNPDGLHQAILSGDPRVGPVAFLMKFPKGRLPMHYHSSDYYALIVDGKMKHWLPGKEAEAKENPPGTFWFQPGGADGVHDDECVSQSCTLYVYMDGKFDAIPAPPTPAPAK